MFKTGSVTVVAERGSLPSPHPMCTCIKIQPLTSPTCLCLNPSCSRMAILSGDRVLLLDLTTRRHTSFSVCSPTALQFISVERQQKLLIANPQCIMRYSLSGQQQLATHRSDTGTKVRKIVVNCFRRVVACVAAKGIELYDYQGKRLRVLDGVKYLAACFGVDGQQLLVLTSDAVIVYDMVTFEEVSRIEMGIKFDKGDIVCTTSGKIVVAAYGKGLFITSNMKDMKFYPYPIMKIRVFDDTLICLSQDRSFRLVNLSKKKYKVSQQINKSSSPCTEFDGKGDIIAGAGPKTVCIFKVSKESEWDTLDQLKDPMDFLKTLTARRQRPKFRKIIFKQSQKAKLIKNLEQFMAKQGSDKLSAEQLILKFFQVYKQFPDKASTHPLILKIPLDVASFESLTKNSKLSSVPDLDNLKDKKLRFQMLNILKALVSLSNSFETHLNQLIRMIYPLLCIYRNDIMTLEIFLKLIGVYGWGLFGGEDASKLRGILAESLEIAAPDLYDHFLGVFKTRLEEYLYPSLPVFLVDLLGQNDWLQLIDNLVVNAAEGRSEFYLQFICCLMKEFEPQLLKMQSIEQAHTFIMSQKNLPMVQILRCTSSLPPLPKLPPVQTQIDCSPYCLPAPPPLYIQPPSHAPQLKKLTLQVNSLSAKLQKSNTEFLSSLHLQLKRQQQLRIGELQDQLGKKDKARSQRRKQVQEKEKAFAEMVKQREEANTRADEIVREAVHGIDKINQLRRRDQEEDLRLREEEVRAKMKKIEMLRDGIKRDIQERSIAQMRAQELKMFDKVNLDEFRNATARQIAQLTDKVKNENSDWMNGMATHLIGIKQKEESVINKQYQAQAQLKRNQKVAYLKQLELLNQQLEREVALANSRRVTSNGYLSRIAEEQNQGTLSSHRRQVGFIRKSQQAAQESSSWSSSMGSSRKIGYISNKNTEKESPAKEMRQGSSRRKLREVGKLSRRVAEEQQDASSSSSLSSFDSSAQQ